MSFSFKMRFFDLKDFFPISHTSPYLWKEMADKYRKNCLCSTNELCFLLQISKMRATIQRQLRGDQLLVSGSVPLSILCATDLAREPQGHQGLPAGGKTQILSHGHSGQSLSKNPGSGQRGALLEARAVSRDNFMKG